MLFLLKYDRAAGVLQDLRTFNDSERALALRERFDEERTGSSDLNLEVILLASDSLDALKRTHARYFKTVTELVEAASRQPAIAG